MITVSFGRCKESYHCLPHRKRTSQDHIPRSYISYPRSFFSCHPNHSSVQTKSTVQVSKDYILSNVDILKRYLQNLADSELSEFNSPLLDKPLATAGASNWVPSITHFPSSCPPPPPTRRRTMNTHDLVSRLICTPFEYVIGFFKAAKVPMTKKRVAFEESR
jgi:hypothetical protein